MIKGSLITAVFNYLIVFLIQLYVSSGDIEVEVLTSLGRIVGVRRGNIVSYLGIPYAEPPIGFNRFHICFAVLLINLYQQNKIALNIFVYIVILTLDFALQSRRSHGNLILFMRLSFRQNVCKVLSIVSVQVVENAMRTAYI